MKPSMQETLASGAPYGNTLGNLMSIDERCMVVLQDSVAVARIMARTGLYNQVIVTIIFCKYDAICT